VPRENPSGPRSKGWCGRMATPCGVALRIDGRLAKAMTLLEEVLENRKANSGGEVAVEFLGRGADHGFVGDTLVLGVGNQERQVGEPVEAAGQAEGRAVELDERGGGEQRQSSAGPGKAAKDIGRRLGFCERAQEAARSDAIGQARGHVKHELGAPDQK
jgi:hypothetical protein